MDNIRLITILPATPQQVYDAWLSSEGHTAMTGGSPAVSEARIGARHSAWDGYISGEHIELEAGKRILQTWRTTEFPETAPDSLLEIVLVRDADGTRITLIQNGIPDGQGEMYHEGWQEHYFAPMRAHFEKTIPKAHATKPAGGAKKAKKTSAKKRTPVTSAKKRTPVTSAKKRAPAKAAAKARKPNAAKATTKSAKAKASATTRKPAKGKKTAKKTAGRKNKK